MAQVSMNLTDFEVTGMHTAYEACVKKAEVGTLFSSSSLLLFASLSFGCCLFLLLFFKLGSLQTLKLFNWTYVGCFFFLLNNIKFYAMLHGLWPEGQMSACLMEVSQSCFIYIDFSQLFYLCCLDEGISELFYLC